MNLSDGESVHEDKPLSKGEFKTIVKEWMDIVDKLDEIRKSTSSLNKRKKQLNTLIVTFMKQNNAKFCNMGNDGALEMKTQKVYSALKKDHVIELLKQYGQTENDAKETAQYLFENKPIKFTNVLKQRKDV